MAYARFSNSSDVYLYADVVGGYTLHAIEPHKETLSFWHFDTLFEAYLKLLEIKQLGLKVEEDVLKSVWAEIVISCTVGQVILNVDLDYFYDEEDYAANMGITKNGNKYTIRLNDEGRPSVIESSGESFTEAVINLHSSFFKERYSA